MEQEKNWKDSVFINPTQVAFKEIDGEPNTSYHDIINGSNDYVIFKVKTTLPDTFKVSPRIGLMVP